MKKRNIHKSRAEGKDSEVRTVLQSTAFVSLLSLGIMTNASSCGEVEVFKDEDTSDGRDQTEPQPVYGAIAPDYGIVDGEYYYSISGKVVDHSTGNPLKGITISFLSRKITTDDEGRFSVSFNYTKACENDSSCELRIAAQNDYRSQTHTMIDSDTDAKRFVSLNNVIRLSDAAVAPDYGVVQPRYGVAIPLYGVDEGGDP